jgi:hypothetical protein
VKSRAVGYLRGNQNGDGGFGSFPGRSSNAQSTAYAVQGLVAARAAGGAVARALGYLRGLQARDGSVGYSRASRQTPVWVTAQALLALRRKPFPLAAVPRKRRAAKAHAAGRDGGSAPRGKGKAGRRTRIGAERKAARSGDPAPLASLAGMRRASDSSGRSAGTLAAGEAGGTPPMGLMATTLLISLLLLALFRRRLHARRAG